MISSYAGTTIAVNVLIFLGWVWLCILRYREGRSWYAYGAFIYACSYISLVYRNFIIWGANGCHLPVQAVYCSYGIYIAQLAATISFIYFNYKHPFADE